MGATGLEKFIPENLRPNMQAVFTPRLRDRNSAMIVPRLDYFPKSAGKQSPRQIASPSHNPFRLQIVSGPFEIKTTSHCRTPPDTRDADRLRTVRNRNRSPQRESDGLRGMIRAGAPTAVLYGGTSPRTTAFAPTTECSPKRTPPRIQAPAPGATQRR